MKYWNSAICKTNGIEISYTRTGGSKPPLILLHGLMTNGKCCWGGLANALENEYDVIMPDARGHGNSSTPNLGYQYEDHANDIAGLIKALKISEPILIGHSMGGMTASVLASRKPNLLKGLILEDPTFLSLKVQHEVYDSDVIEQHRQKLNMSLNELLEDARSRHPNRSEDLNKLFAQARLQTSMAAFDVLTPPNPDYKMLISKIDIPTLLIYGDKGVVSSDVAKELQLINPSLQAEQLLATGHSVHLDQPERFAELVVSFIHLASTKRLSDDCAD